ncbi:hypothetical protein KW795_00695 [Candidatus Microgenomates bacterium]|nr:hypothetical protein [Candidatus Microgenomates bacterium]
MDKQKKLKELKEKLVNYQEKLAFKMKGYRGVIHESAQSELRHSEVMVLTDIVNSLKREIEKLESEVTPN